MYVCAEISGTECLQWIVFDDSVVNTIASMEDLGLSVEVISLAFGFSAGVVILFHTLGKLHGWVQYALRETLT